MHPVQELCDEMRKHVNDLWAEVCKLNSPSIKWVHAISYYDYAARSLQKMMDESPDWSKLSEGEQEDDTWWAYELFSRGFRNEVKACVEDGLL